MRTLAVDAVLLLGLAVGVWSGIWLSRRTDLSPVSHQGLSRPVVWLLRGVLFLGALSLVTVPFQLLAMAIG